MGKTKRKLSTMEEKKNIPQDIHPIQVVTKIRSTRERVWETITTPQLMRQWFADVDNETMMDGETFRFLEMFGNLQMVHECLILEMVKPSLFRHTWAYPELSQASSTVNWDLESDGDLTEVIITHEGIHHITPDIPELTPQRLIGFWDNALNNDLKRFIER